MSKPKRRLRQLVLAAMVCTLASWGDVVPRPMRSAAVAQEAATETASAPEARTTKNPEIPVDELKLLVKPLTLAELEVEAQAWQGLLQDKVRQISNQEIAIRRKNRKVQETEEAVRKLQEAEKTLEEAKQAEIEEGAGSTAVIEKTEQAEAALREAQEAVEAATQAEREIEEDEEVRATLEAGIEGDPEAEGEEPDPLLENDLDTEDAEAAKAEVEEAASLLAEETEGGDRAEDEALEEEEFDPVTGAPIEAEDTGEAEDTEASAPADGLADTDERIDRLVDVESRLERAAEAETDVKQELVIGVTELQNEQTALAERFKVILDAIDLRGGDTESYRQYIAAVSGIEIDVTDTQGLMVRLLSWARSEEGGLRWAINVGIFVGIVSVSGVVSWFGGNALDALFARTSFASELFEGFIVKTFRRGTIVMGVLIGLTALGVSLGPLLALIGGASFILAFALQSNLSNLASGLMLMFYKPFDVGDEVKVAGMWAVVDSISLANTTFKAFSGELVAVPNTTVWNDKIHNLTHDEFRKVKHDIRLNVNEDLPRVKELLTEVMKSHPKVVQDKWIGTYIYWYQEDHIPISASCWATKEDYWTVWEETLIMIQERFKQEGISVAIPTAVEIGYEFIQDKTRSPIIPASLGDNTPSFAKNS
ncbi:mechanosensitive ion channel domain-containing protein [Roseofilum capinflatum]|uniref:Mechanosensitive ion channel n=1 Tax=Roseofilum capinflatum BLCC-M114 TaxID=3022440 RepID=A0ABT7BC16_9CYAN|nr:mechanosensitive ion channel domain-containing protein [Roseofilum capinflatum]MDJ1176710.1 mechanosensitive ion channel [Roseofilum capinflatum BLCC-M114]